MAQFSTTRNSLLNNNDDLYEVVMVSGQAGPSVYVSAGNLNNATDAFGRLRISDNYTLFDSSFRFGDNERRWNSKISGTATVTYNSDQGLMDLAVGTTSGNEIIRQTDRSFSYQPGKSLLILNSFTLAQPKANLRQRVGYFTKDNGIFLQTNGTDVSIVKRSAVSGSVVDTTTLQSDWNIDKLDGTGPSGVTLDWSKSQLMWMDIEWLGVGSVRVGFVHNGQFVLSHIFHHANQIEGTYMTTASLSLRSEITNTDTTSTASTMKQICSTIISEGGYERVGLTRTAAVPFPGKNLTNGINNPMVSIRLRSGRTDAVVIPREITMYGYQNTPFILKIMRNGTLTGANWTITDSESSVEYDLSATAISGATTIFQQIFKGQATVPALDLQNQYSSNLQLARGIITGDSAGDIITVAIVPTTNNDDAVAALTWQERTA